jgi:hypothetical protein
MIRHLAPVLACTTLLPNTALAQTATAATGSQACAALAQSAADGMNARIQADDTSINPPASVTKLSCLQNFFNGVGLNVITSLVNPGNLLQTVEGQICNAVSAAWQQTLGTAQCGLTVTGFNLGFGGLGGGQICPKLSFGGGGPPLGSVATGYNTQQGYGLYMNGKPTTPTGYPAANPGGVY